MLKQFFTELSIKLKRLFVRDTGQFVHYINGSEQLPAPLTGEEEEAAFKLMETDYDKARDTLIIHNLRLVVYIAKKFENMA